MSMKCHSCGRIVTKEEAFAADYVHHSENTSCVECADAEVDLVCGRTVQHDNSGVGHNWRDISARDLPPKVREEIECEIIDGRLDECDDYRATNGLHYRWS